MVSQIEKYDDYREFLADLLLEKTRINPTFQLRTFAGQLKLSPSMLSSVINGKKSLSYARAYDVAGHLDMTPDERSYFCDLVEKTSARSSVRRNRSIERLKNYRSTRQGLMDSPAATKFEEIDIQTHETMGHWYYWALDELLKLPGEHTVVDFAIKLNIPLSNVREALNCLARLGLVQKNKNNTYSRTDKTITTSEDIPNKVIADLHREILDKGKEAISTQTVAERDFSAIMLSVDKKDMEAVKKKISDFRRELYAFLDDSSKTKNDVYCMSVQFFSLLHNERPSDDSRH